jgi:hypothetical protein
MGRAVYLLQLMGNIGAESVVAHALEPRGRVPDPLAGLLVPADLAWVGEEATASDHLHRAQKPEVRKRERRVDVRSRERRKRKLPTRALHDRV